METFTVCFSGTACTRDEGEETRSQSDKRIYCPETGYIPVRIHKEISGELKSDELSVTVRGVGENDWATPRNDSEKLFFDGENKVPEAFLDYVKIYSGGNQLSIAAQAVGWAAAALALHGANLAAASGARNLNFIGHSRGAVEAIMAAWIIYAYGNRDIPIRIFAIDPVPGPGDWYGILTQLPPNVVDYVGIYAWDIGASIADRPFLPVTPRPNRRMTGQPNTGDVSHDLGGPLGTTWQTLANACQLADPLAPGNTTQPQQYELYACRGRHGTVAGSVTSDGGYNPANNSESVAPVGKLVYKMARSCLAKWGTTFHSESAVAATEMELRNKIHTDHATFDAMGGGLPRTSRLPGRPYARRVSSISGSRTCDSYYLEDVVGAPPSDFAYPVTSERTGAGWVKWNFL